MTADVRKPLQAVGLAGIWPDQLSSSNSSKFIGTLRGDLPETGKKSLMTLTANNFFF